MCPKFIESFYKRSLCSFVCSVDLWNVYGECENYAVLKGHSGCVLELSFSPDGRQVIVIIKVVIICHYWIYEQLLQQNAEFTEMLCTQESI